MSEEGTEWGKRVDTAFIKWRGDLKCGSCGIYTQFSAGFLNKDDETNEVVREKTRLKYCMFCGAEYKKEKKGA